MQPGTKKGVTFEQGSSDFDSPVNVGEENAILSTTQIFRGLMKCTPSKEINLTFPSAKQLIDGCPKVPIPGFCKRFSIRNDGRAAARIIAGEGGSIDGDDTVSASSYAAHYVLRYTSVAPGSETYVIIRE